MTLIVLLCAAETGLTPLSTDVQLLDCSKFTDERPASLKSLFQQWLDEACWRAPSVLVLDNIERMLPAEMEVLFLLSTPSDQPHPPELINGDLALRSILTPSAPNCLHISL